MAKLRSAGVFVYGAVRACSSGPGTNIQFREPRRGDVTKAQEEPGTQSGRVVLGSPDSNNNRSSGTGGGVCCRRLKLKKPEEDKVG